MLGRHSGCWRFTVGQRRGLGISAAEPLYVLAIEAFCGRVVVGPAAELATTTVALRELVDRGLGDGDDLEVQLRYQSEAIGVAHLRRLAGRRALVELRESFHGPAPGQSAVFYKGDIVVGGGIITSGRTRCSPGSRGCDKVTAQPRGRQRGDGGDVDD